MVMSAEFTARTVQGTTVVSHKSRPYRDYSVERLVEILERDYDQGRQFNERLVFELAARALEAEAASRE
jgi:hypothetical protein